MTKEEATAKLAAALVKLEALGSPRAIADYFIAEGIKALPYTPSMSQQSITYRCPVGLYLQRETGIKTCWAGSYSCGIDSPFRVQVGTPETVHAFIRSFDQGKYPELNPIIEETTNAPTA